MAWTWPGHTGQQQPVFVWKNSAMCPSVSVCPWTGHWTPISSRGVASGWPCSHTDPHTPPSQVHGRMSVVSGHFLSELRLLCISHFHTPFYSTLVYQLIAYFSSIYSLPGLRVGVFLSLTDSSSPVSVFLFLIPLSFLIWEGRGRLGGRKEKVETGERGRDER